MGVELLIINAIAALCVIFFGGLVIHAGLSVVLNRRFVYFLGALLAWIVLNYLSNQTLLSYDVLLVINRLLFVASILAVATMLHFCLSIRINDNQSNSRGVALWVLTLIISLLSMTPYVVESIDPRGAVVGVTFGWAATGYFATLAVLGAGVVFSLLWDTIKAKGIARARARTLLAAFSVGLTFVTITNAVLPLFFDLFYLSALGSLVAVSILAGVGYSIVKHKLFDMRLAVVRGTAYAFSLMTLAGVYYVLAYAVSITIFKNQDSYVEQTPLNVALALVLAFIFQPVKQFFDTLTNRIFYRDDYSTDAFFARMSKQLSTTTDLRDLLRRAADEIGTTIKAEQSFFSVYYGEHHRISAGTAKHSRVSETEIQMIDDFIARNEEATVIASLLHEEEPLGDLLNKYGIAIVLPLTAEKGVRSYLFLGNQRSREYTRRDIQVLETISDELVIAIQNALSVQEVKEINNTLQQRIEEATKELRQSNAQLQRLDAAKDEFVSMASHQLRTPLTSVKGYLSMVLEGDAGRISATQRQLLGEAFTSSERMVHLIGDFLNVSRLQTGKFIVDQHPVDLAKIIGQEVDSLKTTAEAHSLKLQYKTPSYFPILYIDEGKIRQVVMNFIDNAIYYSHEGTVIKVVLRIEDGDALLEVHDTGIGVPKSEQAHLFSKFFRATNAQKQRPDGTGVGLFLAKKVIVAHGGTILFSSVEGEGSTFGFRLPVKKLSHAPADEADKLKK